MKAHFLIPEKRFTDLSEYRKVKGNGLKLARTRSPTDIITELKASGLKGRGGGGFPTGMKWQTLYTDISKQKYVVVNAAEGEPGTYKDRFLLRKNPYALIEGTLIAAHVLKTTEIYIGIKKTFYQEIDSLQKALNEFKDANELQNINVHLIEGPEDYLFGEEKALLNVIEGIGPLPREAHYPPYEIGLFATPMSRNPALVNNVETYSRVPEIILRGSESFRAIGTEDTSGPIICTLSGDINRPGIYEVEPGLSLRNLIEEYGQGQKQKEIKAVLSGVSNGVLANSNLDREVEFSSLKAAGGGLGSAGFMFYDESRSMPRLAQRVAKFLYKESCNQCINCKSGLRVSSKNLDSLFSGFPQEEHVAKAIEGAKSAPIANRCYLPVQGSILIPSLIHTFPEEFAEVWQKRNLNPEQVVFPLMVDFVEEENRFILQPMEEREPTSQDWVTTDKTFFSG